MLILRVNKVILYGNVMLEDIFRIHYIEFIQNILYLKRLYIWVYLVIFKAFEISKLIFSIEKYDFRLLKNFL